MSKKIVLRPGLSIEALLEGSKSLLAELKKMEEGELPFDGRTRYPDMDAIGFKTTKYLIELLIEHVNQGGEVGRQAVIEGFTTASRSATWAKNNIIENMNNGKVTPTILDKIASA